MSGDPSKPSVVKFKVVEYGNAVALSERMATDYLTPVVAEAFKFTSTALDRFLAMTPAERTANEAKYEAETMARHQAYEVERKAAQAARVARWDHAHACAMDQPVALLDVLALHDPESHGYGCSGCAAEVSGYEYDMEEWPCQTFLIIEKAVVLA